ncbi:hypothetical protein [Dactylosporangium sp. NPDC005555]|uniref:hypothetical protein n=1 Tax=Dactylosporangium sp. NPDC005555 TaxID=3154889 RepID=UPI0033BDC762
MSPQLQDDVDQTGLLGTCQEPYRVYVVAYSPDGATLVAGASDGSIRVWQTDLASAVREVCATAGTGITAAEWIQYLPAQPYRPRAEDRRSPRCAGR